MVAKQEFKCSICNSSFTSKHSLKAHEDSSHKNIRFDCLDCGKEYKLNSQLSRHIKTVHKGMKGSHSSSASTALQTKTGISWHLYTYSLVYDYF